MPSDQMLNQAIAAYKAGHKEESRRLLQQIVRADRSNEAAWLWLSGVAETDRARRACLEQVLAINPANEVAQRGLARLPAVPETPRVSGTVTRPATERRLYAGAAIALVGVVASLALLFLVLRSVPGFSQRRAEITGEVALPAAPENQRFTSTDGHFTVLLPGAPQLEIEQVDTPVGRLQLHMFSATQDAFYYMVGYADYPPDWIRSGDIDVMLDAARDGAVADSGGWLVREQRIKYQGFPGRELWIEALADGEMGVVRTRLILVGNRFYQVLVAAFKDQFATSGHDKFLNSFRIIR